MSNRTFEEVNRADFAILDALRSQSEGRTLVTYVYVGAFVVDAAYSAVSATPRASGEALVGTE